MTAVLANTAWMDTAIDGPPNINVNIVGTSQNSRADMIATPNFGLGQDVVVHKFGNSGSRLVDRKITNTIIFRYLGTIVTGEFYFEQTAAPKKPKLGSVIKHSESPLALSYDELARLLKTTDYHTKFTTLRQVLNAFPPAGAHTVVDYETRDTVKKSGASTLTIQGRYEHLKNYSGSLDCVSIGKHVSICFVKTPLPTDASGVGHYMEMHCLMTKTWPKFAHLQIGIVAHGANSPGAFSGKGAITLTMNMKQQDMGGVEPTPAIIDEVLKAL